MIAADILAPQCGRLAAIDDLEPDRLQLREFAADGPLLSRACGGGDRSLRLRQSLTAFVLLRKANQPRRFPLLEELLAGARLKLAGWTGPSPMLAKRERQLAAAQPATQPNHFPCVLQLRLPGFPPAPRQDVLDSVHHEGPRARANEREITFAQRRMRVYPFSATKISGPAATSADLRHFFCHASALTSRARGL